MEAEVTCTSAVTTFVPDPSPHYPVCSVIAYSTNPPTSGPHYPIWAAYKAYSTPIPRGFWVHDLEHGAAVITYNCPGDCSAEVASLMAFLAARPPDPICVAPLSARIVITPDPLLDTMFAASAWGAHLKSNCFDLPALGAFLDLYYGKGPEASCFDGVDLSTGVPEGCGEPIDAGAMDSGPG